MPRLRTLNPLPHPAQIRSAKKPHYAIEYRVAFTVRKALIRTMATNNNARIETATNESPPPALLTITEAAARLRIGRSTAYELIASGHLEVVHIGRSARVPVDAVDEFVRHLRSRASVARASVTRVP